MQSYLCDVIKTYHFTVFKKKRGEGWNKKKGKQKVKSDLLLGDLGNQMYSQKYHTVRTRTWSTTQHIRKHPKKRAGNPIFRLCMRAPEGPPKGHVISGQNTRKKGGKSNFRLHMRALEGTLSGSRHFWQPYQYWSYSMVLLL